MVSISEDLSLSVFLLSYASVMFSSPDFRMQFFSPKTPSPASDLGGTASAVGNSTLGFSIWTPCIAWVTLLSSAECIATVGAGTGGYVEGPLKDTSQQYDESSKKLIFPKRWLNVQRVKLNVAFLPSFDFTDWLFDLTCPSFGEIPITKCKKAQRRENYPLRMLKNLMEWVGQFLSRRLTVNMFIDIQVNVILKLPCRSSLQTAQLCQDTDIQKGRSAKWCMLMGWERTPGRTGYSREGDQGHSGNQELWHVKQGREVRGNHLQSGTIVRHRWHIWLLRQWNLKELNIIYIYIYIIPIYSYSVHIIYESLLVHLYYIYSLYIIT